MNFKQFRTVANVHARMAFSGGRRVGGRGFRFQSKLGLAIPLKRLEALLEEDRLRRTLSSKSNRVSSLQHHDQSTI